MSVGRICDEGHSITFDAVMAVVHAKHGSEVCRFQRNGSGLYVAKFKLRSPAVVFWRARMNNGEPDRNSIRPHGPKRIPRHRKKANKKCVHVCVGICVCVCACVCVCVFNHSHTRISITLTPHALMNTHTQHICLRRHTHTQN